MVQKEKYGTGVVVALITPLKSDGRIDQKGLETIISHCLAGGVHGIFVLGTTGEGPCFVQNDRSKIIRTARKFTGEDTPLYVGVMDTSTERVKENIKIAEDNGADILVVTPPYYLSSNTQEEIVRHVELSARYASVPVMVYNIPRCTHTNIDLSTVKEIMEIDNVIGLKDSSGDWEQFQKEVFLKDKNNSFRILIGAEELFGVGMLMGADGCVTGIGNYLPELLVSLCKEAKRGNAEKIKKLQHKVTRLRTISLVGDFWLAGLKYTCSVLGLCEEYLSLPFQTLTKFQKLSVRNILKEEGLLSYEGSQILRSGRYQN